MKSMKFHRSELGTFSDQAIKLSYDQAYFKDFIGSPFSIEAFEKQVELKSQSFQSGKRVVLHDALMEQYANCKMTEETQSNIDALLQPNTFTITTGHQLSLFTGPLFFVVKILHVVKQSRLLNSKYQNHRFVPVYWMASEDHDFEEIKSCNLFNQQVIWDTDQEGPVGRFDTDALVEVRSKLKELFFNHEGSEVHHAIDAFDGENYAAAVRNLVNYLFGEFGLVIIDGDHLSFKEEFNQVLQKEVNESFSYHAVEKTNRALEEVGGKLQVMSRPINLFKMDKGLRSRFNEGDRLPEDLLSVSPNVILRPVFQEFILPNVAYVGGAGEISYWLQLKGVFDAVNVPYPLIQVRNSVVWIDKGIQSKLNKFGFEVKDVFQKTDAWKKAYVEEHGSDNLDFLPLDQKADELVEEIQRLILSIDASKEQYVKGEIVRLSKQLDAIKSKGYKFSKANHEHAMKAIETIKEKLFPNNGLQERAVNFFQFCTDGEVSSHVHDLYQVIEPFENDLIVALDGLK
jgi:uncharacterized protein YllA (UPF0747 family)